MNIDYLKISDVNITDLSNITPASFGYYLKDKIKNNFKFLDTVFTISSLGDKELQAFSGFQTHDDGLELVCLIVDSCLDETTRNRLLKRMIFEFYSMEHPIYTKSPNFEDLHKWYDDKTSLISLSLAERDGDSMLTLPKYI